MGKVTYDEIVLPEPTHPQACSILAYWHASAREGQLPQRSDFEPVKIREWLPYFFLGIPSGDTILFRIAGTKVEERTGMRWQGKTARECFTPEAAAKVEQSFAEMRAGRAPVIKRGRFHNLGIDFLVFEAVFMPILSPDGSEVWVAGVLFAQDEARTGIAGRKSSRLVILPT